MSPFESVWCEVASQDEGFTVMLIGQDARDGFTDELVKEYVRDGTFLGETAERLSRAARYGQALVDAEYSQARELAAQLDRDLASEIERLLITDAAYFVNE